MRAGPASIASQARRSLTALCSAVPELTDHRRGPATGRRSSALMGGRRRVRIIAGVARIGWGPPARCRLHSPGRLATVARMRVTEPTEDISQPPANRSRPSRSSLARAVAGVAAVAIVGGLVAGFFLSIYVAA